MPSLQRLLRVNSVKRYHAFLLKQEVHECKYVYVKDKISMKNVMIDVNSMNANACILKSKCLTLLCFVVSLLSPTVCKLC